MSENNDVPNAYVSNPNPRQRLIEVYKHPQKLTLEGTNLMKYLINIYIAEQDFLARMRAGVLVSASQGFVTGSFLVVAGLLGKEFLLWFVSPLGLKLAYREHKLPRLPSMSLIFFSGMFGAGLSGYWTWTNYLDELATMDHKESRLANGFKLVMKYVLRGLLELTSKEKTMSGISRTI